MGLDIPIVLVFVVLRILTTQNECYNSPPAPEVTVGLSVIQGLCMSKQKPQDILVFLTWVGAYSKIESYDIVTACLHLKDQGPSDPEAYVKAVKIVKSCFASQITLLGHLLPKDFRP